MVKQFGYLDHGGDDETECEGDLDDVQEVICFRESDRHAPDEHQQERPDELSDETSGQHRPVLHVRHPDHSRYHCKKQNNLFENGTLDCF